MKWHYVLALGMLAQPLVIASAGAQQAAQQAQQGQGQGQQDPRRMGAPQAVGDPYAYPEGVAIAKTKLGPVHVNAQGKTIYAVNARMAAMATGGDMTKICGEACAANWTPVSAPKDAPALGFWKVVEGSKGSQWSYKGNPLFTFNADKDSAGLAGHGLEENMWTAALYTPPVPKITTPANIAPVFLEGEYVLADKQGHGLFTSSKSGDCGKACANWKPYAAGLAAQGVGEWTVVRDNDRPQWAYRGKVVYMADAAGASKMPEQAVPVRADEAPAAKK